MRSYAQLPAAVVLLALALMHPAAAQDLRDVPPASDVNIFPQGSFENPGANTEWVEGFNIPNNQEFRVVTQDGKSWLRIENTDPNRSVDYVHAYVKCDPRFAALTLSVRMRATGLRAGTREGWHNARIAMLFEGAQGSIAIPDLTRDSDWVTKTTVFRVPAGAKRLNIQPALFYATGVFEISDLTINPHFASGASWPEGDNASPAAEKRKVSAPRERSRDRFFLRAGDVVMVMGDAIIEDGGILDILRDRVKETYPELTDVRFVNAGEALHTCADGLQRLPALRERHRPTVVALCYGVNDVFAPPGEYERFMQAMLQQLATPPVALTVVTPPCFFTAGRAELAPYERTLGRIADAARRLAASAGAPIADCHAAMRRHVDSGGADFSWGDGIHPNNLGRTMMAEAILKAWRSGLPASQ